LYWIEKVWKAKITGSREAKKKNYLRKNTLLRGRGTTPQDITKKKRKHQRPGGWIAKEKNWIGGWERKVGPEQGKGAHRKSFGGENVEKIGFTGKTTEGKTDRRVRGPKPTGCVLRPPQRLKKEQGPGTYGKEKKERSN